MVCMDGTLNWQLDPVRENTPCFGVAKVKIVMNWDTATAYCSEFGAQLPTPTADDDDRLLGKMFSEIGNDINIPLGTFNKKGKWVQLRDGQESDAFLLTKVKPSFEVLKISNTTNELQYEAGLKKDEYKALVCEHRHSFSSVIQSQECDDGFVLFIIRNTSLCILFHEFANPLVDANSFIAVSSYCKSKNAELFEPNDSGDLHIVQKIGEASGFAVSASSRNIHRQYGYINQKVQKSTDEPVTATGYNFSDAGINVTISKSAEALCFMLELPGGSQPMKKEKVLDILGTDHVIITDLKPEIILKEVEDLSYLGVAPEAKRAVKVFAISSVLYYIAISVALFCIL